MIMARPTAPTSYVWTIRNGIDSVNWITRQRECLVTLTHT